MPFPHWLTLLTLAGLLSPLTAPARQAAAPASAQTAPKASPAAPAGSPAVGTPPPPAATRTVIPDGEQLSYNATWRLWKAGLATLTLTSDGSERKIDFSAVSTGVAAILFPVRDQIESDYDPQSFCARQVVKDTLEGRRKRHTEINYYPLRDNLVLDEQNLDGPRPLAKHQVKPIPGCVLDLFSALYYVRTLPLHLGEVYNFPVNEGGNTVEVQLTPDLKERVVTPAGSFATIRAEPSVFNNAVFHRPGRMWIWFSDDARHLPVMVKAKVSWGTITAVLAHVSETPTRRSAQRQHPLKRLPGGTATARAVPPDTRPGRADHLQAAVP